jgi:hypothetical protein
MQLLLNSQGNRSSQLCVILLGLRVGTRAEYIGLFLLPLHKFLELTAQLKSVIMAKYKTNVLENYKLLY